MLCDIFNILIIGKSIYKTHGPGQDWDVQDWPLFLWLLEVLTAAETATEAAIAQKSAKVAP